MSWYEEALRALLTTISRIPHLYAISVASQYDAEGGCFLFRKRRIMRSTQNNRLALVQDNRGGETFQGDISALIQSLQAREKKVNKKCHARNNRTYWIARGRQQALWQVSARLVAIGTTFTTSYTLYLALQEYLACLDKYCIDVEEERHALRSRRRWPIEQWKAEGEAQELPTIAQVLSGIVQAHTPYSVHHTLSLDGKHLVSLRDGSDEPFLAGEGHEQDASSQLLQVMEMPSAGELVLAGSESRQEPPIVLP